MTASPSRAISSLIQSATEVKFDAKNYDIRLIKYMIVCFVDALAIMYGQNQFILL